MSQFSLDPKAVARAAVESALSLDRTSTRLSQAAEARMVTAQVNFDACIGGSDVAVVLAATNALQIAIGTALFATKYRDTCRHALAAVLDELGRPQLALVDATSGPSPKAPAAAAMVVAEATAIAAAAEARLAAETYAGTVRAASEARDAVLEAAATVARAAEDERRTRAVADLLAADEVAAAAVAAAQEVQLRADEAAAAVSAAALLAASQMPVPLDAHGVMAADRLAALVTSDATSKARDTAVAAALVADAVAQAASTVTAANAEHRAATERDVRAAARAVRSMADTMAGEIAELSSRARDASAIPASSVTKIASSAGSRRPG